MLKKRNGKLCMHIKNHLPSLVIANVFMALALALFAGCQSCSKSAETAAAPSAQPKAVATSAATPAAANAAAASTPAVAAPSTTQPAAAAPAAAPVPSAIRIKAGLATGFKDAEGNEWLPDQNFDGGETIERPDLEIKNTKTPAIYRAERYSMNGFSYPVPNGKYIVKLHFCETFEGITGPGERVFSFNVEGREFKDFDVWKKTGGALTAYVETVPVEVADGKVDVTFTPNVENPEINGIEIIPAQ
jgi:hypothetical protein